MIVFIWEPARETSRAPFCYQQNHLRPAGKQKDSRYEPA
jgi:hypothetical protein